MSGVTQTILAGEQEGVYGNCLQAAVATLLNLPLNAVPHFSAFVWWDGALTLWARGRDLTPRTVMTSTVPAEGRCIVGGKSPRGVEHVVVAQDGVVVWDPHPSRDGLVSITDALFLDPWEHNDSECWVCRRPYEVAS